jgi:hypothetical protein
MRVLFVTPQQISSGEIITAVHMAEQLVARGDAVLFLASGFARRFIAPQFPQAVRELSDDGAANRACWAATLATFAPELIVFADYPLLFFSSGVAPLADEHWVRSLDDVAAVLVTLDHLGFAQRAIGMYFGPPHLSFHYETIPALPERMAILLPCPMHEPTAVAGRRGRPFRYWQLPLTPPAATRLAVRQRYLAHPDDYLVFHTVPTWAWQIAQMYDLPYYRFLPQILDYYFADLPRPVTLVSLNNERLLEQPAGAQIRVVNVSSLPKPEYEALMFAADLMITENKMSVSLGKAICGLLPCALLNNSYSYRTILRQLAEPLREIVKTMELVRPGAIYPYDVFPNGMQVELEQLGLYRDNSVVSAFKELEIYGGAETHAALQQLLIDPATRAALRAEQAAYIARVQQLGDAADVLHELLAETAQDEKDRL